MKCTSCQQGTLESGFIDNLFPAKVCNHCGGNWILVEDFAAWREQNPNYEFAESVEVDEEMEESSKALLCPATGAIMSKFRISANTHHRVDYSAVVGGIWLDKGEWQLLKDAGVAGSLNHIVTKSWQHKLRSETAKEHFNEMYTAKFGEAVYAKVKEFREWLQAQPNKADLRAYLLADDPYSAEK